MDANAIIALAAVMVTLSIAIGSYFIRRAEKASSDAQLTADEAKIEAAAALASHNAFTYEVAKYYAKHTDLDRIEDTLRRIEDKLDRKADK